MTSPIGPEARRPPHSGRAVVFWRSRVLPGSETFIRMQQDSLKKWRPTILGFMRVNSPLVREDDVILHRGGRRGFAKLVAFDITRQSRSAERFLRENPPDVIHAHFGVDAVRILPIAKRLKIPLVMTVYGYDVTRDPSGIRGRIYTKRLGAAFEYASAVMGVSQFITAAAIERGADPSKVRLVHLGLELDRNIPTASPESAPPSVLFVGRFTDKKGIDDLIAAMSQLPPELRDTPLVIIGDGKSRSNLETMATELGVNAQFVGSLDAASVQRHMADARMLVVPSRTALDGDSEGLPTVIFEGSFAGLPIVSTVHSGIPEGVKDGKTGILVPERDRPALADAISTLLKDPELAARYGQAGREFVEANFSIDQTAALLEEIYDAAWEQSREQR